MEQAYSKWGIGGAFVLVFIAGYLIGKQKAPSIEPQELLTQSLKTAPREPEIGTISFSKREGDTIFLKLQGPTRVTVDEHTLFEQPGTHTFSFATIPSPDDLALRDFPYLGNTKTRKFYNSTAYPARGTEVKYRRFFESKEAAIAAGFIPMKNLK